jgi:hypothetical protein
MALSSIADFVQRFADICDLYTAHDHNEAH